MSKELPDLFSRTLNSIDYGEFQKELSQALGEVLQGVKDTNKAGELAVKLKVKMESSGTGQISITADHTAKVPEQGRGKWLLYATPEGNLQREDPRQKSLPGIQSATPSSAPAPIANADTSAPANIAQA